MRHCHGARAALDARAQAQIGKSRQKGHLRHDHRQPQQPQRLAAGFQAKARFRFQAGKDKRRGKGRRQDGQKQRLLRRHAKPGRRPHPGVKPQTLGQGLRKHPGAGKAPQGQPGHAAGHQKHDKQSRPASQRAKPAVGPKPPAPGQRQPASQPGHTKFAAAQQGQGRKHQSKLQKGPGGRHGTNSKVGACHPQHQLRRERRRQGGAQHQRHVHRRHRIGQNRIDGGPDLRPDRRQDGQHPARHAPVAKACHQGQPARRIGLGQGGDQDQQQERHFLHHQAGRQGKARRIVQDQKVGRPGPAGGPGRQQPGNPPGRGQQKGQTQRCRRMRHCQQRRQQPQDQCKQPPALQGSHQTKRDRQRQQRRGHAGSKGKCHGTRQAGPVKQPRHAVRLEGRAQGAGQPGNHGSRHQQKGQPGRKAKRPACHHCATP